MIQARVLLAETENAYKEMNLKEPVDKRQQCQSYPGQQGSWAHGKSFQSISRRRKNRYAFTGYLLECLLRNGYR
jgi:hypothetical protein